MSSSLRRLGVLPEAPTLDITRDRADWVIAAAERDAEAIRTRAHAEAKAEHASLLVAARAAFARSLDAEEATVTALACDVARAILGREASSGAEVLRDVARRAMERVRRARRIALRVHPDDVEIAESSARGWLPDGTDPIDLWVVGDDSVERGGVIVETEIGRIDARIDVQCAEVARILDGSRRLV